MQQTHPFHSLCGYLGSFPPSLPRKLLEEWFGPGSVILDPFCGGGTTLLESTLSGYSAIGCDLNPLAVAISAAKIADVSKEEVLHRLSELSEYYPGSFDTSNEPDSIRLIYHERTLQQLKYLQMSLKNSEEDTFLRGVILGIMHGKFRRDGSTSYLSIDMPNTFSMSPEYVRGFIKKNDLSKPPVHVFSKIRERVHWLFREGTPSPPPVRAVLQVDATQLSGLDLHKLSSLPETAKINGVITSPPYLGVLRYGAFNWIRLWFLGRNATQVDRTLDSSNSLDRYLSFMLSFLLDIGKTLDTGALTILVIGDVTEKANHLKLGEEVWNELKDLVPFSLIKIQEDSISPSDKRTRIWGEGRKGKATPVDRIMILKRE